jgi:hypothetical protein
LRRAAGRNHWRELERDLTAWEEWAAELMETHLSYPLLAYYRSQHVNQKLARRADGDGRRRGVRQGDRSRRRHPGD